MFLSVSERTQVSSIIEDNTSNVYFKVQRGRFKFNNIEIFLKELLNSEITCLEKLQNLLSLLEETKQNKKLFGQASLLA